MALVFNNTAPQRGDSRETLLAKLLQKLGGVPRRGETELELLSDIVAVSEPPGDLAVAIAEFFSSISPDAALAAAYGGFFNSIAEMQASSNHTTLATVKSYFGTNSTGGGIFRWENTSAATNLGTVFTAAGGGRWRRIQSSPTVYELQWFGVTPANSPSGDSSNLHDDTARIQDCIAVTPDGGTIIIPSMTIATTGVLIKDRASLTLQGDSSSFGISLTFPAPGPIICYIGAAGGTVIDVINGDHISLKGFGIDSETPTGAPVHHANICLNFDQIDPHQHITTACRFEDMVFRSRSVNSNWRGVAISRTSKSNCEEFRGKNCSFYGSSWDDFNGRNVNSGIGIEMGGTANTKDMQFDNMNFIACRSFARISGGQFLFRGGLGTAAFRDFELINWSDPSSIELFRSEYPTHFVYSNFEGGYGSITLRGCVIAQDGNQDHAVPTIIATKIGTLIVEGCMWNTDTTSTQKIFFADPASTTTLTASGNYYGHYNPINIGYQHFWGGFSDDNSQGTNRRQQHYTSFPQSTIGPDPANTTNFVYMDLGFVHGNYETSYPDGPWLLLMPESGGVKVAGSLVITRAAPVSAAASGVTGTITSDSSFVYVCTATNTWKRAALTAW